MQVSTTQVRLALHFTWNRILARGLAFRVIGIGVAPQWSGGSEKGLEAGQEYACQKKQTNLNVLRADLFLALRCAGLGGCGEAPTDSDRRFESAGARGWLSSALRT